MRVVTIVAALTLCACAAAPEEGSGAMETRDASVGRRRIEIDLLALDLETCGRCSETAAHLDEALADAANALRDADVEVDVRTTVVRTAADAERLRFVSSPTIRVNGRDISAELRESGCEDCGSLCGCDVDCRVWVWRGREYADAPKEMILEAVLAAAKERRPAAPPSREPYRMPENLRRFFDGAASRPDGTCCPPAGSAAADE
jgi:hypothetical protein